MDDRTLDYVKIVGPGVDALERRETEVVDAVLADARARSAAHRNKQIAILADAMSEHGHGFTEYEIQKIGHAVFAAVGRVIVERSHSR